MARRLHDQAYVLTCTGGTDDTGGSGVSEYIIYALRSNYKGESAPDDGVANFAKAFEITRIGSLDSIQGFTEYLPANSYDFDWYNWEEGYHYRFWYISVDFAGNVESRDSGNTSITASVMSDSVAPQFIVHSAAGALIDFTSRDKSSRKPWGTFTSNTWVSNVLTIKDDENGQQPDWANDSLIGKLLYSIPDSTWFNITDNGEVAGEKTITVDATGIKDDGDGTLSTSTTKTNGAVIILSPAKVTMGVGIATVEYESVDPNLADIDHYKVERYVNNVANPSVPADFDFDASDPDRTESIEFVDFNIRWNKLDVTNGASDNDPSNGSGFISGRGLYKITPYDIYDNPGHPTITWGYINSDGYFPVTGTPPAVIPALAHLVGSDGDITLKFDEPADDDLRGFQIERQRYLDGTAESWERIVEGDVDSFLVEGGSYDREYADVNLEPWHPDTSLGVQYKYRIRGTDYSGNTALTWTDFNSGTAIKAVDTSVNMAGASLGSPAAKIGAIAITITPPSDGKSTKCRLFRSVNNNNSYESDPFKIVEVSGTSVKITQDEFPEVDETTLIFYEGEFEDKWGNISTTRTTEVSTTSKTPETAGDSQEPDLPQKDSIAYVEKEAGTVTLTNGDATVTKTGGGDFTVIFAGSNERIHIIGIGAFDVLSVTNANSLELTAVYDGLTQAGLFWQDDNNPDYYAVVLGWTSASEVALTGTITLTSGDLTVTLVGGSDSFIDEFGSGSAANGKEIKIDTTVYTIASVTNANSLELQSYGGGNQSGLAWINWTKNGDIKDTLIFGKRIEDKNGNAVSENIQFIANVGSSSISIFKIRGMGLGRWEIGLTHVDKSNNEPQIGGDVDWDTDVKYSANKLISDTIPPASPSTFTLVGGIGRATFSWNIPLAIDLAYYKVYIRDESNGSVINGTQVSENYITVYTLTATKTNLALYDIKVIAYDSSGNSSTALIEKVPDSIYLNNYIEASGSAPDAPSQLTGANQQDNDILVTLDGKYPADLTEIELFILERKESTETYTDAVRLATITVERDSNGDPVAGNLPDTYHDVNIVEEAGNFSKLFNYRLISVSHLGKRKPEETEDTGWSDNINCTDTTGIDLTGLNLTVEPAPGAVFISFNDVADKNGGTYEILRSPDNNWATLPGDGTPDHERVLTVQSVRGNTEFLRIPDYDWDNFTGLIPDEKTKLAAGAYSEGEAYYRIIGIDRFGNRSDTPVTSGKVSPQSYRPALPIDENTLALFEYNKGFGSTKGQYPSNLPQVYLDKQAGKYGGAVQIAEVPDNILEFAALDLLKEIDGDMEDNALGIYKAPYLVFDGINDEVIAPANIGFETMTDLSIAIKFKTPSTFGIETMFLIVGSNRLNSFAGLGVDGSGELYWYVKNSDLSWTTRRQRTTTTPLKVSTEYIAILTKSGDNDVKIYIDGALDGSRTDQFNSMAPGTGSEDKVGYGVDIGSDAVRFTGSISRGLFFNRALSADDALYYSKNFPVKNLDRWGGEIPYTSDFSAGIDSWANGNQTIRDGNIDSIGGEDDWLRVTMSNTTSEHRCRRNNTIVVGSEYRITGKYFIPSSNTNLDGFRIGNSPPGEPASSYVDFAGETAVLDATTAFEGTFICTNSGIRIYLFDNTTFNFAGGTDVFYVKDLVITLLGCVLEHDFTEGAGSSLRDKSSNGLIGTITGATWVTDTGLVKSQDKSARYNQSLKLPNTRTFFEVDLTHKDRDYLFSALAYLNEQRRIHIGIEGLEILRGTTTGVSQLTDATLNQFTTGNISGTVRVKNVTTGTYGKGTRTSDWQLAVTNVSFVIGDSYEVITNNGSGYLTDVSLAGDDKFDPIESVIDLNAKDNRLVITVAKDLADQSVDAYLDMVHIVRSFIDNGGFEGTYASGLAPDWNNQNANTLTEENTKHRAGSAAQKISADAGEGVISSFGGDLTIGRWYLMLVWARADTGTAQMQLNYEGNALNRTVTTTWERLLVVHKQEAGHVNFRLYATATAQTYIVDDAAAIELNQDFDGDNRMLKYPISEIGLKVDKFTIDMVVSHPWETEDGQIHELIDSSWSTNQRNRFILVKSQNDQLEYTVYGDTHGGRKRLVFDVTEINFAKNVLHRLSIRFDASADEVKLFLNGVSVGTADNSGSWVDPTAWLSFMFIGASANDDNQSGNFRFHQLRIEDAVVSPEDIRTWNDIDKPFIDLDPRMIPAGVISFDNVKNIYSINPKRVLTPVGTVAITNGSATVEGSGGTDFTKMFVANEEIEFFNTSSGNVRYTVQSITDADTLVLTANIAEENQSSLSYRNYTLRGISRLADGMEPTIRIEY